MNFIFDLGNVLFTFKPEEFIQKLFPDRPLQIELAKAIFLRDEWLQIDLGELTFNEASEIISKKNPAQKADIQHVFEHICEMLVPMTETVVLLPKLKESGHKLYYLSNIGFDFRDYLTSKHEFFDLFDGGIFSCDVNIVKPDTRIYRVLLDKYNLSAQDCIFFDDIKENVKAASDIGIRGIHFTDIRCIKSLL